MIPTLKKNYGAGASSSKFMGGQSRDIFRGGPVKKNHPVIGHSELGNQIKKHPIPSSRESKRRSIPVVTCGPESTDVWPPHKWQTAATLKHGSNRKPTNTVCY